MKKIAELYQDICVVASTLKGIRERRQDTTGQVLVEDLKPLVDD